MVASTAVTWEDTPGDEAASRRTAEIASLTGLRGFAALMVVLIHTAGRTELDWLGLPTYGPVSLFVISGFLLYRPWARWSLGLQPRPALRPYLLRRATRIFPAYWLVLVVVALVVPASRPVGIEGWWRAVTLTWIYRAEPMREALLHTWSLATEVSWYLALPVMAGIVGHVARRYAGVRAFWLCTAGMALSLPMSIGWRVWTSQADLLGQLTYPYWLPSFVFCFAGGAFLALLAEARHAHIVTFDRLTSLAADPWAPLLIALALTLVATSSLAGPTGFVPVTFAEEQVRSWSAASIAWLFLCVVVLAPGSVPLSRLLGTRWFSAVGRWSYGIYLWHVPVVVVLERDIAFPDGPLGLLWRLTCVLAISLPLAAATYAWVERPTMAWSRRFSGQYFAGRRVVGRIPSASTSTANQPSSPAPAPSRRSSAAE